MVPGSTNWCEGRWRVGLRVLAKQCFEALPHAWFHGLVDLTNSGLTPLLQCRGRSRGG
jgi:hypothetical protein